MDHKNLQFVLKALRVPQDMTFLIQYIIYNLEERLLLGENKKKQNEIQLAKVSEKLALCIPIKQALLLKTIDHHNR